VDDELFALAPLGFATLDVDFYSSSKDALALFEGRPDVYLPFVTVYVDDLALSTHTRYAGELLAIREFNDTHTKRKICKIEQLRIHRPRWENWQDRMYAFHNFAHSQYNTLVIPDTDKDRQLPL